MNHLSDEKSPYLLQHAQNPVDWYPWGTQAFAKAAREDRPIFLSIGYSTCHWCHVMAHESFEDREVAALLNSNYVCIKVDREERPDIDAVYMAACQAVTGSGGWPLTVVITPDQKPFFLGTYLPRHQRYGQPGLVELLQNIHLLWHQDRKKLTETGQQIAAFISDSNHTSFRTPDKSILKKAVDLYCQQYDRHFGGFGNAPKFPAPHNLLFLLSYGAKEQDEAALKMAEHTLDAMAQGGINDQIGGGFSRYSTDEKWLAPHFEKMLYDNALLAIAYLEAFQLTKNELYAHTARRTLDYVLKELTGPEGEFYCGQDADSDGIEGKYYLFTRAEVLDVLGHEDGEAFCRTYDITDGGNFEGSSIPNLIGNQSFPWPQDDVRLKKLYDYRINRTTLHRDDKVILSWNSWMIIAMAKAALLLGDCRYRDAAVSAHLFIKKHMTDSHQRLYLRWRQGEAANDGQLDDYAVYSLALLELYRTTFQPAFLQNAASVSQQMLQFFEDKKQGGYFLTASDAEVLIARPKEVYDGAIPSGNSAVAILLYQLSQYTGNPLWQEALERQMSFLSGTAQKYPVGHSFGLLALINILYPSAELVCVSSDNKMPEELTDYLRKTFLPNLTVILKTEENQAELEEIVSLTKDYPLPQEGVMYYLCKAGMCLAPVSDFNKLDI